MRPELASQVEDLQAELADARAALRSRDAELEAQRVELGSIRRTLERRERDLADARSTADRHRGIAERAVGRADALGTELVDAKSAGERLRGQVALAHDEVYEVKAKLEDAVSDSAYLRSRLETREAELEAAVTRHQAAERSASDLEETIARTQQELAEARELLDARTQELSRLREELAEARVTVDQTRLALQRERAEARTREQALVDATLTLRQVSGHLDRIEESRSWRFGHAVFKWLRILTFRKPLGEGAVTAARSEVARAIESAEHARRTSRPRARTPGHARRVAPPEADDSPSGQPFPGDDIVAALAREIRDRIGPPPALDRRPLVSILVLTRDGRALIERLLAALRDRTEYDAFELVVVDNGSTDGSVELLEKADEPFAVKLVRNDHNASFSEANNQAAEQAEGELLLLLNNDVQPVERHWLTELVACRERTGAGAIGALLAHADPNRATASGWEIQHRGIRFARETGVLKGFNEGAQEDLLGPALGADLKSPAVTAACILVGAEQFRAIGGLHPGYRYGSEDIDFCLSLWESGETVVCCGRAVLLHAESSTQRSEPAGASRTARVANLELFHERWGPRLWRQAAIDRLRGTGFWMPDAPPRLTITRTSHNPHDGFGDWYTAEEIGNALTAEGFAVDFVEARADGWHSPDIDADYVLALLDKYDPSRAPPGATTIAWIRNWTERWTARPSVRDFSVLLTSSAKSAAIVARETRRTATVFPLATNPHRFRPLEADTRYECDYAFAGHRWGVERPIETALQVSPGDRVLVFGKGWEKSNLAPIAKDPLPYDELPGLYSSAKLILDDAAPHTLPYDAVNARVFDALACGAVVLTNCADGVRALFDDEFPTYDDAASLRQALDRLLRDERLRRSLADRYRRRVLEAHTYSHRARQLKSLLEERLDNLRFCIKVGAPGWDVADQGGDVHLARALQRELRARGHDSLIQVTPEWDAPEGLQYDVALHLRGRGRYRPKPGQFNVLWCISHPAELTAEECDAYDLVCVASARFASRLAPQTETPVHVLEQATDAGIFYPERDERLTHDLVFVANSRGIKRRVMQDLLPTDRDLAVWGRDWEGLIAPEYVMGEHLALDDVRRAYSSAAIVLADHWDDMREHGFVSNRIYDALACGAFVVSDRLAEIDELFAGAVATYEGRDELNDAIESFLADRDERARRAARGQEIVLADHTFERRAEQLLELVEARYSELGLSTTVARSAVTAA